jgi:hypothetical protein
MIGSRAIMSPHHPLVLAPLLLGALLAACDGKKDQGPAPPSASASATASGSAPGAPDAPQGPFSIVLEAKEPVVFSALEGGVFIADAARSRAARAMGASDLVTNPMPHGLPEGPGRVVRAAGRAPASTWLLFEKLRADGKVERNPLYRLGREGFTELADDWKPAIAAWSHNRVLAASTSSGRLKIKVIEPSLPKPPDDLPGADLADASCLKTLALADLAALKSGEVFAAGTCKPDLAAGAGASAKRYVILRWPAYGRGADAGAPGGGAPDAGAAGDGGVEEHAGTVDVIPGVSVELTHQALCVRSAADVYAAALESTAKPPASRLFHFDGTTWGAEALPAGAGLVRGLASAAGGVLWMVTDHAIWRRTPPGAWEQVPPPGAGAWEMLDVRVTGADDVWIAARQTAGAGAARDVILRTRPQAALRWE